MFRKAISPRTHALIDLVIVATRIGIAAKYWKRKPRVALGSLIAAAMGTTYWSVTDMPFTPLKLMSYRTHLAIDGIQAPLVAAMPLLMGFGTKRHANIFYGDALASAVLTSLSLAWQAGAMGRELLDTPSSREHVGHGGPLRDELLGNNL